MRMASGSQSISCPVRKPRAKDCLAGSAARRAASPGASPRAKLSADLVLEIPHLPAQGRLSRVQSPFGRNRQAALLGDGDEITKMSQLHERPMPWRYGDQPTKSFSAAPAEPKFQPEETI